jgi:hypothetical protein
MSEYNKIKVKGMPVHEQEEEIVVEERAVAGQVVTKPKVVKKGLMERLVVSMIGPDGLPAVGRYISKELIGPAAKQLFFDSITSAAHMMVFKDGGGPRNGGYSSGYQQQYRGKTDYGSRYRSGGASYSQPTVRNEGYPEEDSRDSTQRLGPGVILVDWAVGDRGSAQRVLNELTDLAQQYGNVRVSDYYGLMGIPTKFTDNNYGWLFSDMDRTRIRSVRGEFVLDLPPIKVIK